MTTRITTNPPNQPVLNSEEFWFHFYPSISLSSRIFYENYLRRLEHGSLDSFWPETTSAKEFVKKYSFIKRFEGIYWNALTPELDKRYTKSVEDIKDGVGLNQLDDEDYLQSFEKIEQIRDEILSGAFDPDYLWGIYLPPRRLEIYSLVVSDNSDAYPNTYNPKTGVFTLKNFKKTRKTVEIFTFHIDEFIFIPEMQLNLVKGYLNSLSEGTKVVDAGSNVSRWISKKYRGVNNNMIRAYWATLGKTSYPKQFYLKMLKWVGHDANTSVASYAL